MQNRFRYDGTRVLICGCYSGMGEATAQIVRSLGAEVVAVDVKKPSFDYAQYLEVDLRDPKAIEQMVASAVKGGRIDRLFYCAGLPGTKPAVDVMGVNFIGLRHTVEQCVPHLPRDGGAIATISSAAGMAYLMMMEKVSGLLATGTPAEAREWVEKSHKEPWFESYSFSKMCTIVWTFRRGATLTPATGIRLNCISPGPTDTPMMPDFVKATSAEFMDAYPKPIGRMSTADEQGWVMAFLNSPAASYISGENVYTDGGAGNGMMVGAIKPPALPQLKREE
jgi:NAD(P)-dependent dehydrogenase (short-subunit alcohol dehydrogenase family)